MHGMGAGEEQGRVCSLCGGMLVLPGEEEQFIRSGGFGTACEPLCCISQILFFTTEKIARILFRHKAVGLHKLQFIVCQLWDSHTATPYCTRRAGFLLFLAGELV